MPQYKWPWIIAAVFNTSVALLYRYVAYQHQVFFQLTIFAQSLSKKVIAEWLDARCFSETHDNERQYDTMAKQLTAIIEREGDGYFALCPELDITS